MEDFDEALRLELHDANYYFNRGNALLVLTKLDAALVDLNKAIELAPDVSMYYHSRGMCYQQMDQKQQAIEEFKHALSLNSHQVPSRYHLGLMYRAISTDTNPTYNLALKEFSAVLAIDRSDRRVHEALALVHRDMTDYMASVEALTHAIELEPEYPDNYFNRGQSLYLAEQHQKAIEDYDTAEKLGMADASVCNARALAWTALDRFDLARLDLSNAIALDAENPETLFQRSNCFYVMKEP